MRHFAPLALAFATLATSSPLARRDIAKFPAGTAWDIVLNGRKLSLSQLKAAPGSVIDIDLEDNWKNGTLPNIKELAKTKKVICYFSAGSREEWRSDDFKFTTADYGKAMGEWDGEWWLDVKSANVRKIMKARIEVRTMRIRATAAEAGCHAVDPDNVDGYGEGKDKKPHQDGFKYDQSVYAEYITYLAGIAHGKGLAIGLKNAMAIIPDVKKVIDFAVNEQCHEEQECDVYTPLTALNLAVFNIEYGINDCSEPAGVNLSTVVKNEDQELDTIGGQC